MAAFYYPKGFLTMADNILKFLVFSLSAIILVCSFPKRFRRYLLLAANAAFYFCIASFLGGGIFLAEIVFSHCLMKFLERYKNKFVLSLCIIPPRNRSHSHKILFLHSSLTVHTRHSTAHNPYRNFILHSANHLMRL